MWTTPTLTEIDKRTLRRLRVEARRRAQEAQGQERVKAVLAYVDLLAVGAIGKILPLIENEPRDVFSAIFDAIWQHWWSKHAWNQRLLKTMLRVGPHPSVEQLPELFIAFRGCHRRHVRSLSWALKPEYAL
jgi:hypothetical protein